MNACTVEEGQWREASSYSVRYNFEFQGDKTMYQLFFVAASLASMFKPLAWNHPV